MTHPDTPELDDELDTILRKCQAETVKNYITCKEDGTTVAEALLIPAWDERRLEAKATLTRLLAKRELEGRIAAINNILENHSSRTIYPLAPRHDNYIIDASYVDTWLAELREELGRYE